MAAARSARLLLAASLAAVTACSNDNTPTTPKTSGQPPGVMTALVDGAAWSAGGVAGSPAGADLDTTGAILIVGHRIFANGSGSNITLHVEAFVGPGTYTLRTGALSGARAIFASYTTALDTTKFATDATHTGTFTVTSFDPLYRSVKGTFSFAGYDAVGAVVSNVTSGVFDVSF